MITILVMGYLMMMESINLTMFYLNKFNKMLIKNNNLHIIYYCIYIYITDIFKLLLLQFI